MQFSLGCELPYTVADQATLILNIEAARSGRQTILSEELDTGSVTPERMEDGVTGNRFLRLHLPAGEHVIRYAATVEVAPVKLDASLVRETPVAELPIAVMPFINPSRYCLSDELARFANREFGGLEPGHDRVTAICNWINERVDYERGTSDTTTTAVDTFAMRAGVCRDFSHLGITLCRALGIPARFVSSYAYGLEPPDFHAIFEAWLDGQWYLFDATRQAQLDGIVRIGSGRDAADAAFASHFGSIMSKPMRVWMDRTDVGGEREPTIEAVSTVAA